MLYNNFDMEQFVKDINKAESREKEKKPLTEKQVFFVKDKNKKKKKKMKKK
tara:strand:- start:346 stop:498 length:153 start_codon:yes stop_codon:yes gene_type:complete